jgi:hypothetical protein
MIREVVLSISLERRTLMAILLMAIIVSISLEKKTNKVAKVANLLMNRGGEMNRISKLCSLEAGISK